MKKTLTIIGIAFISLTTTAQQYKLADSEIVFKSTAEKEDITAKNSKSIGVVDFSSKKFTFKVSILKFIFPNELMQEHFNENYMESESFPYATYKGIFSGDVNIKKDGVYRVTTKGTLSIHGVEVKVEIPATITVKGNKLSLGASFKVKPEDHGIKIPGDMTDNIAKEMEVTISGSLTEK